jgi:hypothetical protein
MADIRLQFGERMFEFISNITTSLCDLVAYGEKEVGAPLGKALTCDAMRLSNGVVVSLGSRRTCENARTRTV